MPIFEFQCKKCGQVDEHFLSINDTTRESICSKCSGLTSRIVSLSSFYLKGNCWSKDGYTTTKDKAQRASQAV